MARICLDILVAADTFVEPSEVLTVRVESSDEAVVVSDDATTLVNILDSSTGKPRSWVAAPKPPY